MNILDKIVESKKVEVKNLKKKYSNTDFEQMKYFNTNKKDLYQRIKERDKNISIIAEIKRSSPSAGLIRENFDHLEIARIYSSCDVECISVLTDHDFFGGNIQFLGDIAEITSIPLLRKDFIIDEIQILEAKAFGASAILLIAEILDVNQIFEFTNLANEIGLDVLLELHSADQINKIDFSLNKLIGINNRNLVDFSVDLRTTEIIMKEIPDDVLLISESGIKSKENIDFVKKVKVNGILVGEHLMQSKDIKSELLQLIELCDIES
jgi:indole-3-glycerol phosphate synthase